MPGQPQPMRPQLPQGMQLQSDINAPGMPPTAGQPGMPQYQARMGMPPTMVGPGAGQMRPGNVNQIIGGQMIGGPPMPGQMMRARMAGTTWGHTQEVTLQQRNPQMMPGGPSVMTGGPPGMIGGSSEIPANSPVSERPPPPPFNTQPGPPQPPNNPQTDEERRQVYNLCLGKVKSFYKGGLAFDHKAGGT